MFFDEDKEVILFRKCFIYVMVIGILGILKVMEVVCKEYGIKFFVELIELVVKVVEVGVEINWVFGDILKIYVY